MTPKQKKWIDESSYFQLLSRWIYAPAGDPIFNGDAGKYYAEVMKMKRSQEKDNGVAVSKLVMGLKD